MRRVTLARGFLRGGVLMAVVCGCGNLPAVPSGTCGNAVIEAPEDCDSFAPNASAICLPRGTAGECHFDCRRQRDGSVPWCPAGWGCGPQGTCRPPTGEFEAAREFAIGGVRSLMAGDFDGDGRGDVVSVETPDIRGGTKLSVHYFDESGVLDETRAFPKLLATPAIADINDDARGDIVFSDEHFRVGLLLGQSDRRTVPEAAGSYRFPDAGVRLVSVHDRAIQRAFPILGLTTIGGVHGFYGPDQRGVLRRRGLISGPVETLLGDPPSGNVIEDPIVSPCWEVVLAVRDAPSFLLTDICTRDAVTDEVLWREEIEERTVALDPPAPLDAAPLLVDLDGDGHLDVLVGAGGRTYVAYGDGRGLRSAIPYRLPLADGTQMSPDIAMPLAAGDFTGDGVVDFVFGDRVVVSLPGRSGSLASYELAFINPAAPWTVARIADLNGNDKVDVVAASSGRLGVDFFNGTGTENLFPFSIPTSAPVRHLAVGDFDGDLLGDLALIGSTSSEAQRDSLTISFGNLAGAPEMPVTVARISHVEQLISFSDTGLGNLGVAYTDTMAGVRTGVLALFGGSGDRLPFAPYELVNVSEGALFRSSALAVTVGRFTSSTSDGDVLTLATGGNPAANDYEFWLLPALGTSSGAALRLGIGLDPRLRAASTDGAYVTTNVAVATLDLDGDGRDEALWAIPADDGTRCGLVVVGARGDTGGAGDIAVRSLIVIDETCPAAQLVPFDADEDGRTDLALLTGGLGLPGRKLLVLWNDGAGGLATSGASIVNAGGDSPEQFTALPATAIRPLAFVYVTDRAAVLVSASAPRVFGTRRELTALANGSGVVATDVNGDGIVDLALAASGNVRILAAQLAP